MSGRHVISVRGLGKRYQLGETFAANTARDAIASGVRRLLGRRRTVTPANVTEFWALRDVSFDVDEGEVLGIIGANGAGKSTLLKILSQITEPTTGEVRIRGRVASLLEVGTGFHQELSGRENVFMNGAILGMTQAEIRRKFDEIVAFAGVESFIDTPVKRYSSGMLVRLGFAVAAHLEPEILVVDEVLAVGDAAFQSKCLGKMEDVSRSGRTVLFVSHNMAAVESLCSRAVLLRHGQLALDRDTEAAVREYATAVDAPAYDVDLTHHPSRVISVQPALARLQVLDATGTVAKGLVVGKPATFRVELQAQPGLVSPAVAIHVYSIFGQRITSLHTRYQAQFVPSAASAAGTGTVFECHWPLLQLSPGRYRLVVGLDAGGQQVDRIEPAVTVDVAAGDFYRTGRVPLGRDGVFWPFVHWRYYH